MTSDSQQRQFLQAVRPRVQSEERVGYFRSREIV
jgi:hypothetical protein